MSTVHIRHITKSLETDFRTLIDMADYKGKPTAQEVDAFHSRAQAAYSLVILAKIEPAIAAKAITDAYNDNGIDALYYDEDDRILYLVQSKWHKEGKGTIESGDIMKFAQGVRNLLDADFARFSDKLQAKKATVLTALDDPNLRIHLVLVHTGIQALSVHSTRPLKDLLEEINDASNIATTVTLGQKELHKAVSSDAEGSAIKLEVMLHEWGQCKQPYSAYYGQVEAGDIGRWWTEYQQLLFAKNLRKFTGSTDVNEAIKETLLKEPAKFWYFNNGITILCTGLKKKALGGSRRTSGVFACEGVSVVNGAQTVGCIGEIAAANPDAVANARVSVRLISLANCPEEFGTDLTRAANTQNRIERRDFAALDPEQERLRKDLQLELGKSYFYKSGDTPGPQTEGCTIEEATVALACANSDSSLAVQAKREVGKLWEDITRPPYKLLFNGSVTALKMWRMVEILRLVDASLKQEQEQQIGRQRMVAVHGNRLILHCVFRAIGVETFDDAAFNFEELKAKTMALTPVVLQNMFVIVEREYSKALPHTLFKNASKCKVLAEKLATELDATSNPRPNQSKRKKDLKKLSKK